MVTSMAIIGAIDNTIPLVARDIGLWQFHFVRALMAAPLVIALSLIGLGFLRPQRLWAVALRSVVLAVSMLFYFSALALMPIAQALAGLFTSPIFILIITALVLRQKIGPWRIAAVTVGFLGILLVLQPDPTNFSLVTLVPVAAGFLYALSAMITRHLCAQESTVSLLAGMWLTLGIMGALGVLALSVWPLPSVPGPDGFVTRGWVWPMWGSLPWVMLQAVGSVAGVYMIIKAYQLGEPSQVAVFEYSVMIFGPLYALAFFGQTLGPWEVAGIGLILVAGVIIALRSK
ncbi:MAG: DMT family transporter, partial [Rhodobacteraceae bacterium]